jgi:hypothetical protein
MHKTGGTMSWFQNLLGKFSKSPQPMPQATPTFETLDQDGRLEFRPIVYHFAHTVLPEYFFLEHPNIESVLAQDSLPPAHVLMFNAYFWSRAHAHCAEQGMWHADNTAQFDYLKPLMLKTSFEFFTQANWRIFVVQLPPCLLIGEASLVAFCVSSSQRRYFLLEKNVMGGAFLCECNQQGDHMILASVDIPPTASDFFLAMMNLLQENQVLEPM